MSTNTDIGNSIDNNTRHSRNFVFILFTIKIIPKTKYQTMFFSNANHIYLNLPWFESNLSF